MDIIESERMIFMEVNQNNKKNEEEFFLNCIYDESGTTVTNVIEDAFKLFYEFKKQKSYIKGLGIIYIVFYNISSTNESFITYFDIGGLYYG